LGKTDLKSRPARRDCPKLAGTNPLVTVSVTARMILASSEILMLFPQLAVVAEQVMAVHPVVRCQAVKLREVSNLLIGGIDHICSQD
jgi:hypothetical protein